MAGSHPAAQSWESSIISVLLCCTEITDCHLTIGREVSILRKEDAMSEKEKKFVELISQMPEKAQDAFLAQAQGAVIMLDALREKEEEAHAEG